MEIRSLETERLWLRPLELADAVQVQAIFPHWEIVRYLKSNVPWPFPEDGVLEYYRDVALPAMARCEEWHWTLRWKTDPHLIIGSIAVLQSDINNRGFWIGLPWQGQGLISEATEVVNDFWFNELGFPRLRVPKASANVASCRISQKNGMRLVGMENGDYVSGRLKTEIWELTAEEWRARRFASAEQFASPG